MLQKKNTKRPTVYSITKVDNKAYNALLFFTFRKLCCIVLTIMWIFSMLSGPSLSKQVVIGFIQFNGSTLKYYFPGKIRYFLDESGHGVQKGVIHC